MKLKIEELQNSTSVLLRNEANTIIANVFEMDAAKLIVERVNGHGFLMKQLDISVALMSEASNVIMELREKIARLQNEKN